jgi:hypothetical protein
LSSAGSLKKRITKEAIADLPIRQARLECALAGERFPLGKQAILSIFQAGE